MTKLFQEDVNLIHDLKHLWHHADKSAKVQMITTSIITFGLYAACFALSMIAIL